MKLFIDEDTGASLGRALAAVGVDAWHVTRGKSARVKPGTPDEVWIPLVAGDGRLILSRNIQMLDSPVERQLLIAHSAGVIYLPPHSTSLRLLQLVLKKWSWLELIAAQTPRPFAYRLTAAGLPITEDLLNHSPRPRRRRWHSVVDTGG